jgi:apolipoprotein N-acyltransferase
MSPTTLGFGDSTARQRHLQSARMRALEAGRPLLRAANDGISGIIDAHGSYCGSRPACRAQPCSHAVV